MTYTHITSEQFAIWAKWGRIPLIQEGHGFKVGDQVTHTNLNGVVFTPRTIVGMGAAAHPYGGAIYLDRDCWWFPVSPSQLKKL